MFRRLSEQMQNIFKPVQKLQIDGHFGRVFKNLATMGLYVFTGSLLEGQRNSIKIVQSRRLIKRAFITTALLYNYVGHNIMTAW